MCPDKPMLPAALSRIIQKQIPSMNTEILSLIGKLDSPIIDDIEPPNIDFIFEKIQEVYKEHENCSSGLFDLGINLSITDNSIIKNELKEILEDRTPTKLSLLSKYRQVSEQYLVYLKQLEEQVSFSIIYS